MELVPNTDPKYPPAPCLRINFTTHQSAWETYITRHALRQKDIEPFSYTMKAHGGYAVLTPKSPTYDTSDYSYWDSIYAFENLAGFPFQRKVTPRMPPFSSRPKACLPAINRL